MISKAAKNMCDNYLICTNFISEKTYYKLKTSIVPHPTENEANYYWINFKPMPNELPVVLDYANHGYQLPLVFDTLFLVNNPEYNVTNKVIINHALLLKTIPVSEISMGHSHIGILYFDHKIPTIIKLLQPALSKDADKFDVKIGICNSVDFAKIKQKMKREATKRFSEPRY